MGSNRSNFLDGHLMEWGEVERLAGWDALLLGTA